MSFCKHCQCEACVKRQEKKAERAKRKKRAQETQAKPEPIAEPIDRSEFFRKLRGSQ